MPGGRAAASVACSYVLKLLGLSLDSEEAGRSYGLNNMDILELLK